MIDKDNIMARLADGDSIETIAKEIANTLNEANQEYEKILQEEAKIKAEEEAAAKEAELQAEIDKRTALVQRMEEVMMDYIAEFHPKVFEKLQGDERMSQESLLDVASAIDTICAIISMGLL